MPSPNAKINENKKLKNAIFILIILLILFFLYLVLVFGTWDHSLPPESCNLQIGILCTDAKVTENSISLGLRNGLGQEMRICNIICDDNKTASFSPRELGPTLTNDDFGGSYGNCINTLAVLKVGEMKTVTVGGGCKALNSQTVKAGTWYRGPILITYYLPGDSGNPRVWNGHLYTKVKAS